MQEFDCWSHIPANFTGKCRTKEGGTIYYLSNGKIHSLDGPAIEHHDRTKLWYKEGKIHRIDGPAAEYPNGNKHWWIEGNRYSEEEFNEHPEVIMYKAGLAIFT